MKRQKIKRGASQTYDTPSRLSLRRDVGNTTSGRNFCCIVGGFSIRSIEKH